MDADDFDMPSPKRQRTTSPEGTQHVSNSKTLQPKLEPTTILPSTIDISKSETITPSQHAVDSSLAVSPLENASESEGNAMLDALMQHVESESKPLPTDQVLRDTTDFREEHEESSLDTRNEKHSHSSKSDTKPSTLHQSDTREVKKAFDATSGIPGLEIESATELPQESAGGRTQNLQSGHLPVGNVNGQAYSDQRSKESPKQDDGLPPGLPAADIQTIDHLRAAAEINGLPTTADTIVDEQVQEAREWETDSSPYDSSDTDSSTLSSSDDSDEDADEDAEGTYTMMDALEQARILMQDGGSDDEGERSMNRGGGTGLRTANERSEEIVPKPNIHVTEGMVIEELGCVENIVEGIVVVKATVPGEYQVLESGSLLCLQDRNVIGVISETLGRVEQPLYTIRFGSDTDIKESGVSEKGTKVFYVKDHSTFVFTQPLKAVKGSDASNFHDEEVGDDEMEFSDDEAEAEHKRMLKLKRRGIDPTTARGRGGGRGGRSSFRGARGAFNSVRPPTEQEGSTYGNGSLEMNYDEVEEGEAGYTPLQRPVNFHEMMGGSQPMEVSTSPPYAQGRGGGRGRGRSNDRSNRGHRGGGNRGGRGGGGFNASHSNSSEYSQNLYKSPMAPSQLAFATPPPPPALTPQNNAGFYQSSFSPSPISPLPKQGFNFPTFSANMGAQQQSPAMPLGNQFQQMWQNWQAQQQFQQQQTGWNNGTDQWQQGQSRETRQPQYANNAEAVAQVQQHLNELKRGSTGNSWPGAGQ